MSRRGTACGAHGAAKAGIAGFMRCLWLEGLKYGITVNVLAPTAMSRLTEDILPETGTLSGNFPQTYSHVGVINAAFRLSRDWD